MPDKIIKVFIRCVLGLAAMIIVLGAYHDLSPKVLYSASSPDGRYRASIKQTRVFFPITERHIHLDADHNGKLFVHKLLYTGDFLDGDFTDLYPNPQWQSNSTLEMGRSFYSEDRRADVDVTNETSNKISYALIESSLRKFVVFDVEPKATVNLTIRYAGWLSCEGEYAGSKERFGSAVGVTEVKEETAKRHFFIRINRGAVTIESPQLALKPAHCCASDRPDFDHERLAD